METQQLARVYPSPASPQPVASFMSPRITRSGAGIPTGDGLVVLQRDAQVGGTQACLLTGEYVLQRDRQACVYP